MKWLKRSVKLGRLEIAIQDLSVLVRGSSQSSPLCTEQNESEKSHAQQLVEAVEQGKISAVKDILQSFPDCIQEEIPGTKETVLHSAVKNCNLEMVKVLLGHLRGKIYYDDVVNGMDDDGNTALHIAVASKQIQIIQMLLENESAERRILLVNAKNRDGFRALDILYKVSESTELDMKIEKNLRRAGEKEIEDMHEKKPTKCEFDKDEHVVLVKLDDRMDEFFHLNRSDILVKKYSRMLIVAALIATMTFHAALKPPSIDKLKKAYPVWYYPFVWLNSVAFFTSVAFITVIIHGLPIKLWLHISVFLATGAYICAVLAVCRQQIVSVICIGTAVFFLALLRGLVMHQTKLHNIHLVRVLESTSISGS